MKDKLKKISEYEWEIPKTGKMKVPGKIFISEKMLANVEEMAVQQVVNVAELPGIIRASIAMPDIHSGYGFPIGGVAAFDLDKGIVSPGGVGYDINCLTGDSKILTEFGSSIKIKDFSNYCSETEINNKSAKLKKIFCNICLPTLNLESKETENKAINLFMSKKSKDIYEIELESGLKIKATLDHPFLTKQGMVALNNLEGNELAVNTFEGVEHCKITKELAILTKLIGYLFGDGCLYKSNERYYAVAYGSKEDLERIKKDLEKLKIKSKVHSRERNHKILTKYKLNQFTTTNHELHIYGEKFIKKLNILGVPCGNKTRQKFGIPSWIKNSDKLVKRLFLAGFFGAELSSPKASSKTCFFCPTIDQNKIEKFRQNMRDFLIDISLLLEEFGINNTKISEMDDYKNKFNEKTKRFRLLIKGESDMLKLWKTIGFEYNSKRKNLANIASLYIQLKFKENEKRQYLAKKIKSYRQKGFKLKEVQKLLSEKINKRFIERHYYENASQRINLDFISFNEFKKNKLLELKKFGVIFDKIKLIRKVAEEHKVYDFNMEDNHNFIANNFVVSNCGVRLLATDIPVKDFLKKRKEILHDLYRTIPSGVGRGHKEKISDKDLKGILKKGAEWAVEKNMGTEEDLEHTEENGRMKDANPKDVSDRALKRGLGQVGTLGAGNHFLEIEKIEEIYDEKIAKAFGLDKNGICIMIHCGSRGLGHQVASDYIKLMEDEYGFKDLPDRELINAPIKSDLGKKYLSAMNCAVNYAFCNRQIIMNYARGVLKRYFPKNKNHLVYDVCHNVAKIEEHIVDGKKKKVCVHRKGATRSFGAGRKEIPQVYRKIGQPVLIPGSMGTSSYVLVGTKKAEEVSWGSTAHGAGRVMSRHEALRQFRGETIKQELEKKDVVVEAGGWKSIAEEAPGVYKDIDEVVKISHEVGIGNLVVKVKPLAVMKG